jgi:hypothetical protein
VVISHGFWQTRFGGDASAIGRTLTPFGQPFAVVGVTPASFTGLEVGDAFDVVVPLCTAPLFGDQFERRDYFGLTVMGRLKPDWPLARAHGTWGRSARACWRRRCRPDTARTSSPATASSSSA